MSQLRIQTGVTREATFTDQNSLYNMLNHRPEVLDAIIVAMGNTYKDSGSQMLLQLLSRGMNGVSTAEKVVGSAEFEWAVKHPDERPMVVIAPASSTTAMGQGFTRFKLIFQEKLAGKNQILGFPSGVQAIVIAEPYQDGNGWMYELQINGSDSQEILQAEDYSGGALVGRLNTAYPEKSKGGDYFDQGYSRYRNQFTTVRSEMGITGSAKATNAVLKYAGEKSGTVGWLQEQKLEFLYKMLCMMDTQFWTSRYNKVGENIVNRDFNGHVIQTGSGLREQLSSVNHVYTSGLNVDLFDQMTIDLSKKFGSGHVTYMITGAGGMYEFNKALKEGTLKYQSVDQKVLHETTGVNVEFGRWFTAFRGYDGQVIIPLFYKALEDTSRYPVKRNGTNWSEEGYNMYLINGINGDANESNLQMVTRGNTTDGYNRSFVIGESQGLVSVQNNDTSTGINEKSLKFEAPLVAHTGDYTTVAALSESACIIRDTTTCGVITIR